MKRFISLILAFSLSLPLATAASAAGADFGQPKRVSLAIGGNGITNGKGFMKNFAYLTEDDMERVADSASGEITYRLGLGDSFSELMTYSTFENHGTPTWIYRRVYGLDLTLLAQALGIDTAQKMSISVSSADGMSKTLTDAFGYETKRIAYDVYGDPGSEIGPVLALFETSAETEELGSGVLPRLPQIGPDSPDRVSNVFGYGQTAVDEINSCYWVKDVNRLRFGSEEPALTVRTAAGRSVSLSVSGIVSLGVWDASFGSVNVSGIPLSELLAASDISLPAGYGLEAASAGGKTVFIADPQSVFAAWSASDGGGRVENSTALRLYFTDGRVFGDLASLSVEKAPDAPASAFLDLDGYGWAREAIESLHGDGIVNGISDGVYAPGSYIRRADFVLMLCRAYGLRSGGGGSFADVPAGAYYAEAVGTAKALGIAQGDGTFFRPADDVTRQEAMVFICRTLRAVGRDLSGYNADLGTFSDSGMIAGWAVDSVMALVGAGIINGKGGVIDPCGSMTRAEMAVALYRTLNL